MAEPCVVGLRVAHVARPLFYVIDRRSVSEEGGELVDEGVERGPGAEGEVHRFQVGDPARHGVGEDAGDRAHVCEVAGLLAVTVDREGLSTQRGVDEGRDHRGIRVAGRLQRAVDVEEAEGQRG